MQLPGMVVPCAPPQPGFDSSFRVEMPPNMGKKRAAKGTDGTGGGGVQGGKHELGGEDWSDVDGCEDETEGEQEEDPEPDTEESEEQTDDEQLPTQQANPAPPSQAGKRPTRTRPATDTTGGGLPGQTPTAEQAPGHVPQQPPQAGALAAPAAQHTHPACRH